MSMIEIVLVVATGVLVAGGLWAADGRPRLAYCAIGAAVTACVAAIAALVGVA